MKKVTKIAIEDHLVNLLNNIIKKRTIKEPFDPNEIFLKNPFGARVVPMEVWKGSKFERSFVTSLGQNFFEHVAKLITEDTGSIAINQYTSTIKINTFRNTFIEDLLNQQRTAGNTISPDWNVEVNNLLALNNRNMTDLEVISDLYVKRPSGEEEFYSLKTVKPNLDQTEIAKRNMLRILAFNPISEVYFALPYNPAGEGNLYRKSKHILPYRLFEMDNDPCVLIGEKFWNKLGQDPNTYSELLSIFDKVGANESIPRILNEYF